MCCGIAGKKEVVKVNKVVTGKVTSVSDKGLALRLPADFRGMVPAKEQNGDGWRHIALGSFLRCLVLCCKNKEGCVLSLNLTHRSGSLCVCVVYVSYVCVGVAGGGGGCVQVSMHTFILLGVGVFGICLHVYEYILSIWWVCVCVCVCVHLYIHTSIVLAVFVHV